MQNVFISATTKDLAEARQRISSLVLKAGHYPIFEEAFAAESNDVRLRKYLNRRLQACSAVIHLAGRCYGGEATSASARRRQQSWTQMEYVEALRLDKQVFVGLADPAYYRGKRYYETGSPEERRRKAQAQRDHCAQLQKGIYHPFKKLTDLTGPVQDFLYQKLGRGRGGSARSPGRGTNRATSSKTKILFIGAERGTDLDLRGQLRRTRRALKVRGRRRISLVPLFNATLPQICEAINREQPSIVHLSGKQDGGRIMLHDRKGKLAPTDASLLAHALAHTTSKSLKLVVLDTCLSMKQAKILISEGVPYAIGIYDDIADEVATDFFASFYSQIGSGDDLKGAMQAARTQFIASIKHNARAKAELEKVLEQVFEADIHVPRLVSGRGFNPAKEFFA